MEEGHKLFTVQEDPENGEVIYGPNGIWAYSMHGAAKHLDALLKFIFRNTDPYDLTPEDRAAWIGLHEGEDSACPD